MTVHLDLPAWVGVLMWSVLATMAVTVVVALVVLIRDFVVWDRERRQR